MSDNNTRSDFKIVHFIITMLEDGVATDQVTCDYNPLFKIEQLEAKLAAAENMIKILRVDLEQTNDNAGKWKKQLAAIAQLVVDAKAFDGTDFIKGFKLINKLDEVLK
jgi:hypothetical protein